MTHDRVRRTWLVGEHNPHWRRFRDALSPYSPSGLRLRRDILGVSEASYLSRFRRVNLAARADFDRAEATGAALLLASVVSDGDAVVLLGERVWRAFFSGRWCAFGLSTGWRAVRPAPGAVRASAGARWRPRRELSWSAAWLRNVQVGLVCAIPHPSGRSRLWNDSAAGPSGRPADLARRTVGLVAPWLSRHLGEAD